MTGKFSDCINLFVSTVYNFLYNILMYDICSHLDSVIISLSLIIETLYRKKMWNTMPQHVFKHKIENSKLCNSVS